MPRAATPTRPSGRWLQQLRGDPTPWLLEESNPAVRWQTLRHILDRPADEPAVQWAQAGIITWEPIQRIISRQYGDGGWGTAADTARVLSLLAELGLPADDPAAGRACHYLMRSLNPDGGFWGMRPAGVAWPWQPQSSCLPALALFALLRFGLGEDARVQAGVRRLAESSLAEGCRCQRQRGGLCWWGTVCTLRALSEAGDRSGAVAEAADAAADLLLSVPYWDAAHPAARDTRWTAFSFPCSSGRMCWR